MAAPNQVEIANMGTWNIYRHYYRYRQMYVNQGSAIAAGIRTMLQKAQQSIVQAQPPMRPSPRTTCGRIPVLPAT